jgi:DNA phosphorothioation-associated putative methyltransferase
MDVLESLPEQPVLRHRTAIRRYQCSRPVAIALADGIISRETTAFDYGCGHGADLRYLRSRRIRVTGWDPHYLPRGKVSPADVVNLGFVLNVIEDPLERAETLRRAFSLTNKVLIVAVRVDYSLEEAASDAEPAAPGDGQERAAPERQGVRRHDRMPVDRWTCGLVRGTEKL